MRIERALKERDSRLVQLRDAYSSAKHFGPTHAELLAKTVPIIQAAGFPQWVSAFLKGYDKAQIDSLYESHLVFGGYVDGRFLSTHRRRADYYGLHMQPSEFVNVKTGHYWAHNLKPFFLGA